MWGIVAAVHYWRAGLTLAHYDARAHLVVARRVFDSLTPGWQQVGAVWLPLPHLLDAVPVQIDVFYRTGLSGIAISILSMAAACWAIAALIHRATGSITGGVAASALLMLNPDVLYLQSTPMTEPLLFGTTFVAVALIAEWAVSIPNSQFPTPNELPTSNAQNFQGKNTEFPKSPKPSSALRPLSSASGGPPSPTGALRAEAGFGGTAAPASTRAAGWAAIAAVLTRYEAWPIVATAIGLAFVVLLRRGVTLPAALRAVRGLALWPLWAIAAYLVNSKVTVGAWFVSTGFFVPDNPALGHPWLAWTQIWEGLVRLTGPVLPWAAVASAVGIVAVLLVASGFSRNRVPPEGGANRDPTGLLIVLALAASAALPWSAYVKGHPVRIRYDVPLVAAAAALAGTGIALLPRRLRPIAGVAIVAAAVWQAPPFQANAPVVIESQREAQLQQGRRTVTAYLAGHWDGQPILMSMGSLAHYMHDLSASGFGIKDFLHEGNGEIWIHAVRHPAPFVEWIAIEEHAEGGDALHWKAQHDENFLKGFVRVAEGGNVSLYRRLPKN